MPNKLLKKIKKANIPNSYYIVMVVAIFAVAGVIYLAGITGAQKEVEQEAETAQTRVVSQISQRINDELSLGMNRSEVIRRLGEPTWATIWGDKGKIAPPSSDIGLELRWENPTCREAVVMFSPAPHRVIGWDDGAHYCNSAVPTSGRSDFECSLEARRQYCTP